MEKTDIAALVVVILIASAETFCLFICSKLKNKSYPLRVVLPVYAQDKELPQRLEYIASLIEEGSSFIEMVLLIDIDGTQEQIQLCREFCRCVRYAELIQPENIEKYMKNHLHFK